MIIPPSHLDLLYPTDELDTQLARLATTLDTWTGPAEAASGKSASSETAARYADRCEHCRSGGRLEGMHRMLCHLDGRT